jgi:transposase
MSRLEQRAVIRYLTLKNLTVTEIATELQGVYGRDALKYSTVSKWRLRFRDGSEDLFDLARSGRLPRRDLATAIQQLLQQFPFISCKVLCHKLKIGKATCLRVLHDDLHLEKANLRIYPIHWKTIKSGPGSNFPKSFSRYSSKIEKIILSTY